MESVQRPKRNGKTIRERAHRSMTVGMKVCTKCGEDKPVADFHKDFSLVDGLKPACRLCVNKQKREWRKAHEALIQQRRREEHRRNREARLNYNKSARRQDRLFRWKLEAKFGITIEQYEEMHERQQGRCAICNKKPEEIKSHRHKHRLCIDHCHATGIVRGLLCVTCNAGLGHYTDSPERLRAAADYLENRGASHAEEQNSLNSLLSPDVRWQQHVNSAVVAHGRMAHQDDGAPEDRREVHQPHSRDHSAAAV